MYYRYRCQQVEWLEHSIYLEDFSPNNCANPDVVAAAIRSGAIKEGIYKAIADARMAVLSSGACCPCPDFMSDITSKVANCQASSISWDLPNGSRMTVSYDPLKPWSFYMMQINQSWFPLAPPTPYAGAIVTVYPCLNYGCCYRVRSFCKNPNQTVSYWDGPWLMQGPPCSDPTYQNCKIINCGE